MWKNDSKYSFAAIVIHRQWWLYQGISYLCPHRNSLETKKKTRFESIIYLASSPFGFWYQHWQKSSKTWKSPQSWRNPAETFDSTSSCLGLHGATKWSITSLLELSIVAFQAAYPSESSILPNSDIASGTHRRGASFISDSYFHISLCCLFSP